MRLNAGDNLINYSHDVDNLIYYSHGVSMPTAGFIAIRILLNITIPMLCSTFLTTDINYFYLNMPMEIFEYMSINICDILYIIIKQ